MKIITRFAPSPTGHIHIGNLRSILFSYIFCKKNIGKFYLRIDNTDFNRSKEKYFRSLIETFNWFKIKFDNKRNIIFQNKRKSIYLKYAFNLIKNKKAYFHKGSIKYRINKKKKTYWYENKKKILFCNSTISDFVIVRKNNMSTYNFSTVIDDHYLKITHVLRGIEHINNTAKQINIAKSLKFKIIKYMHFSNLVKKDKKKISKRDCNSNIKKYRLFFHSSIISYILNSCGKNYNMFCNLKFFIKNFKLQNIKKCPTILNKNTLSWYNKEYIRINFKKIILILKKSLRKTFFYFYLRINSLYDIIKIKKSIENISIKKGLINYYYFIISFYLKKNMDYKLFRKNFIRNNFPISINIAFVNRIIKTKKSSSFNGKEEVF